MRNNLKELRKSAGLSLQGLGDMCGKSKAAIWELEQDRSSPRLSTAYVLAKVLDVKVEEIWPNNVKIVEEKITVRRVVAD